MTIYTFVIYMFFIFVLGKNAYAIDIKSIKDGTKNTGNGYLWISESKASTLPREPLGGSSGNGINTYRFLSTIFNEKLYAFQRTNSVEGSDRNMFIWTSADNGITWVQESKVPCTLDAGNGACDVMSSMIVDNELVVIYGNNKEYSIAKSADGAKWETGTALSRETMSDKKILYYSGIPSDLPDSEENQKRYIICYETDEEPPKGDDKEYLTVAACSASSDEGKTWKVHSFLRVKKSFTSISEMDHIHYFDDKGYFIAKVDKKENVVWACTPLPTKENENVNMHCEEATDPSTPKINPVLNMNMNSGKNNVSLVMKDPEAYVLVHLTAEGNIIETLLEIKSTKARITKRDIKTEVTASDDKGKPLAKEKKEETPGKDKEDVSEKKEVDGSLPIVFHIMYMGDSSLSIMYEYNKEIFNINAEVRQGKQGCQFLKEQTKKAGDELTNGYTKTIFYDKLDSETEKVCPLDNFEPVVEDGYVTFFVKVPEEVDFETSENCFKHSHVEDGEVENESSMHKRSVIQIKNVISLDEETEIKMKEIEFTYPSSLHNMLKYDKKLTCTSNNFKFEITYTFKSDDNLIKSVTFPTLVMDFEDENNRLTLADYKWNNSVPATATGSYVLESANYMKRFQVYVDLMNNTANAANDFADFQKKFPKEMKQLVGVYKNKTTKDYDGIDFTGSSERYETVETDIEEEKTFSVKVVVPEEGKIVGLLCPLENSSSLDELHCFDTASTLEKTKLTFEEIFDAVPFFISPKIMIYNEKIMAAESLLHLNEDSYNALEALPLAIHFQCTCKVNTHEVTIKFAIGTSSSDFTEGSVDPIPIPDDDLGRSTRSILSSVVVLFVLLNVFSYTSFLN